MSIALHVDRQHLVKSLFLVALFAAYTILNISVVQDRYPDFSLAESIAKGAMRSAGPFLVGLSIFVPLVLLIRLGGRRFKVPKEELADETAGVHMWVMLLWIVGILTTAFVAEIVIAAIASAYA